MVRQSAQGGTQTQALAAAMVGPILLGAAQEVDEAVVNYREDDPTPLLEDDGHIKLVALSVDRSDKVSKLLERRRRGANPISALSNGNFASINIRGMLIPFVKRRFPPLVWVPQVTCRTLMDDLVAGLTVGVMAIPQAMSYAAIVGVPYVIGLYTAFVPVVVYAFLGTSRQLVVGPVAMESLLIASGLSGLLTQSECPKWYAQGKNSLKSQSQLCPEEYTALVLATTFVVGLLETVSSIFGLGVLLRFLGKPVITGFTAGSAIVIMTSQLKDVFGIKIPNSETLQEVVKNIHAEAHHTSGLCVALALAFIAYLLFHRFVTRHRVLKRYLWWLQPLGPLIVVIVGALMLGNSPYLQSKLKYVGHIPEGMPPARVPITSEMLGRVFPTAFGAFVVGDMEAIAIGKGLADKHGYSIDSTQELLAQGVANLVGSFFSCYTATGSFSRSAVNDMVGGKTQLAALISALVVMFTLLFLTSWFFWVPKFALAAIVITSVIPLVDVGSAIQLYKMSKKDFVVWLTAASLVMFLGILQGIAAGVALSLAIVIYETAKPQIIILWRIPGTTIYRNIKQESTGTFIPNVFICRLGSSLYFANAQYVKDMLLAYVTDVEDVNLTEYLVLEMTPVISMDSTACHVIHDIVSDFRSRGIEVGFAMIGNRVDKTMGKAKLKDFIGEQWLFPNVHEAVVHCLRHQYAKNQMIECGTEGATDELDVTNINVGFSNEVGFSNDMHGEDTTVFITLSHDVPMIMSEVTAIFKKSQLNIIRAQIEPLVDDGAKHIYYLRSIKSGTKLSETEITLVRKELEELIRRHNKKDDCAIRVTETAAASSPKMDLDALSRCWTCSTSPHTERIAVLERELSVMRDRLHAQGEDSTRAMDSEGRGSSRSPRRHGRDEHRASPTAWQKASKKFCCYYIA
mmetsp:Transcript_10789/g.29053  ORF Transcript_10789/g.29053 Transcript_10789/m.29053 type:complete len:911 (+) Transcript_10789:2-2734(+)